MFAIGYVIILAALAIIADRLGDIREGINELVAQHQKRR